MKMKFTFRLAGYLFLLLTFFTQSTKAQCIYVGPEPDSVLTPDCTTQTTATYGNGVGAGAYRFYSGFSANTWYYFNLGNEPGDLTCASANFADVNKNTVGNWSNILTNTAYMLAPANTNYVWVQTAHSGGWTGTSAVLTYGVAVPSNPVWASNPVNVCTNTPTVYSVNPIDYVTGYVWTISGSGYFNGDSTLTTLTSTSNSITVTFTAASSSDSISVYATNNGVCSSSTVATYFNSFVSPVAAIGAGGSSLCPGLSTTLDVSYNGAGTPLFQWQYFNGSSWTNVTNGTPGGVSYTGDTSVTLNLSTSGNTPAGTYQYQCIISQSGCASQPLSITVFPAYLDTLTQTICAGELFNGYSATGIYTDTFTTLNGCDSIRVIDLTVLPVPQTSVTQTICAGEIFEGYTNTGTFVDTFTAINGCDSIRTLNLTVLPVATTSITQTICTGEIFEGHSTSGTFVDTFTAVNGCDSIRTLNLTVLPIATTSVTQTICAGQIFEGYSTSGIFVDTFTAANGCDSIRTLNLTVLPVAQTSVTQTICQGQTYEGYSTSGTFADTYTGVNGCDSIRILNLTVITVDTTVFTQSICQGDTFMGATSSGTYFYTLTASSGCDSILKLQLNVLPLPAQPTITQSGDTLFASSALHYQWYQSGTLLPGDTNQILILSANGTYTVQVSDGAGCTNESNVFSATGVGIYEVANFALLSVYPNPASDLLTIDLTGLKNSEHVTTKLFDALGQQLTEKNQAPFGNNCQIKLDVKTLAAGFYLLQVQQKNWTKTLRIVINR